MKVQILLLALLLIPLQAYSQGDPAIDNLMAKLKARNYSGAVEDCNRVIAGNARNPKLYIYYLNRGIAKTHLNDLAGARADFDNSVRLKPDNDEAYVQRGMLFRQTLELDSAMADYSMAIRSNPRNAIAFQLRAELNFDMHNYDAAIADYDQAILKSSDVTYFAKRGRIKYLLKRYTDAIDDYTRGIQIDPTVGEWWFFRALCKSLGSPEEFVNDACYDFSKAKELGYDLAGTGADEYCDFDHFER